MSVIVWDRTRPDLHHDFVARDGEGYLVGRIRLEDGLQQGKWAWFANGVQAGAGTVGCALHGVVDTRAEAIDSVKAAWAVWMAQGGAARRVR